MEHNEYFTIVRCKEMFFNHRFSWSANHLDVEYSSRRINLAIQIHIIRTVPRKKMSKNVVTTNYF